MQGNPTGAMGLADYLGWSWRSKAGLPIVNVPGCPVQPDNFMETVLYLLYQVAGLAPMIPLDDQLWPTWLFWKNSAGRMRPPWVLRAGPFCGGLRRALADARTSEASASAAPCPQQWGIPHCAWPAQTLQASHTIRGLNKNHNHERGRPRRYPIPRRTHRTPTDLKGSR